MSTPLRFSPFLQLKAGLEKPAIFIAHGLSGTVQVSELAKHIQTERPVYGIQAKGLDGKEDPFDSVEDMAGFYLNTLHEIDPQDPYILIGYSFGGLVALEMAQRLLENGKGVALLVMLDAYPHPRFMPAALRARLIARRTRIHARHMFDSSLPEAFTYFTKGLKHRLQVAKALNHSEGGGETSSLSSEWAALRRVSERAYAAYANYRPRFYPGKINFVTTAEKTFFPGDPREVWTNLSKEIAVEVVPGNHLNIVTTEFETLASVLTRYVQAVPAPPLNKLPADELPR
jgi:acetoacetyl-CoA synthetase